jgi:hypothetical protein
MKTTTFRTVACLLALLLFLRLSTAHAQTANRISAQEAKQIAVDAYVYGYSLVTMEMTRRVMTNVRVWVRGQTWFSVSKMVCFWNLEG